MLALPGPRWLFVAGMLCSLGCHTRTPWDVPVAERTAAVIQEQLVGTWEAQDASRLTYAFDQHGRVAFIGHGTDAQEVDDELLQGQVKLAIEQAPPGPMLGIVYPPAAAAGSRTFRLQRLTPEQMELAEVKAGQEAAALTFVRISAEPLSVIETPPE